MIEFYWLQWFQPGIKENKLKNNVNGAGKNILLQNRIWAGWGLTKPGWRDYNKNSPLYFAKLTFSEI